MELIGEPIEGEGGDRKVTVDGRNWRVRVRVNSTVPASAPSNGDVLLAPSSIGISVSVAALNEEGQVELDADGAFLVFDAHVLTFQTEQLASEDFDPNAVVNEVITDEVERAGRQLVSRQRLSDFLGAWTT